jgi:hypothetical protein
MVEDILLICHGQIEMQTDNNRCKRSDESVCIRSHLSESNLSVTNPFESTSSPKKGVSWLKQ